MELAPGLYNMAKHKMISVVDAIREGGWMKGLQRMASAELLQSFVSLWHKVQQFSLNGKEDKITWNISANGNHSAKSAYEARFMGREVSPTAALTWKSTAPLKCRFLAWLALQGRVGTSDRLARRGLPHQDTCPFCDQHDETIQHLLVG